MFNVDYSGKPVFFATPNLSGLKLKISIGHSIDYKLDVSFDAITKVHPTSYDKTGNSFWHNRPLGVINFDKKRHDATIFGFTLLANVKGSTAFLTKRMVCYGKPTTYVSSGKLVMTTLAEAEDPIYMTAGLLFADPHSRNLVAFAFGAVPTSMLSHNGWLELSNLPNSRQSASAASTKCICSTATIMKSGCKCGGN